MPDTDLPYITIEVPRTTVPARAAVELRVEDKGQVRLTRRARRLLGVGPGDKLQLIPAHDYIVILRSVADKRGIAELR